MKLEKTKAKKDEFCYFCSKKIRKGQYYYKVLSFQSLIGMKAICVRCEEGKL